MSIASSSFNRILVIKLGALGDVVQALGPMAAIRDHHKSAHITVLTTAPFEPLLRMSGYANEVWSDERPSGLDIPGWMKLRRQLRQGGFDRVYDLQTSGRSSRYFRLFWPGPKPEWSGIAQGCSHPHNNPDRDAMHTLERQKEQLQMAGIRDIPAPSLKVIHADIARLALPEQYCVFVPGGAEHRPEKRWPVDRYREFAKRLGDTKISVVICGTANERSLASEIAGSSPSVTNLVGETSLVELVSVMRGAMFAVGNDSGPMHVAAVQGIPSVVLYSHASDPALCAQRGKDVAILRAPSLQDISVEEVLQKLPVGAGS